MRNTDGLLKKTINVLIVFIVLCYDISSQTAISPKDYNYSVEMIEQAVSVKPHKRQYDWQLNEFTAFIHFGVNTFTGKEWGTGLEDPLVFNPENLDTDQWCEAIKSAGMKMVIFTAKHHDGFCLWQTRYTDHSVKSSAWRNGNGDVLKDLAASCKKYDLKLGIYLSPADLFQIESKKGLYGNGSNYSVRTIPKKIEDRPFKDERTFQYEVDDYNEYFMNQLFELLTEYGPVHEVWFDGAHPKRKGDQKYTYNQWYELIRELAPEAVIFGKGPDVRWCGNEAGRTRESEWSVIPIKGTPDKWTWPDMTDEDLGSLNKIKECLDQGGFLHWYPAETNTSIRHEWFWRDEGQYVKTADEILDIWYRSVGGNSVFLLNIPPNNEGLLPDRDIEVLKKVGAKLQETFSNNLAADAHATASSVMSENSIPEYVLDGDLNTFWMPEEKFEPSHLIITLPRKKSFNRIVIQEHIKDYSQRISEFSIEVFNNNQWIEISKGTTIGYKRICRFQTVYTDSIKLNIISSRLNPTINNFSVHFEEVMVSNPLITRDREGIVSITCSSPGPVIKYTTDGTTPHSGSPEYLQPFKFERPGIIKAVAFDSRLKSSSEVVSEKFDISKSKWKILAVSSEQADNGEDAYKAIDGNTHTNWITKWRPVSPDHPHFIAVDLGEIINFRGFSYTPRVGNINGTIKNYKFYVSNDGNNWELLIEDEFENIKNNPVKKEIFFGSEVSARYIKLLSLSEINGNPWASAAEIGIITK